ncbi:MAG TPA: hypothetical protein VG318_07995 [Actinomycetota bacterium]|nr:hypothetical protein [Actinomycetota bacterium]
MSRLRSLCVAIALAALCAAPQGAVPAGAGTVRAPERIVRGVYGRDSTTSGVGLISAAGFDSVTVGPWKEDLDALRDAGMRGVVWLWDYDDATCSFEKDDAWVRRVVRSIAGHPAILAYQVADEPSFARVEPGCPRVPEQVRARSDLIHSLDPGVPTYVVIPTWDGREAYPYQYFAGTTDVMGLDVYPCWHQADECQMEIIDDAIEEADEDGVPRYWAVLQDFDDGWYRSPTAAELDAQFERWAGSRMEGYFVYHWNEGGLESKPDHLAVLAKNNLLNGTLQPER